MQLQRALRHSLSEQLQPRDFLILQQTIGNRAVQRLLESGPYAASSPAPEPGSAVRSTHDAVQRKEISVTITTPTRARKLAADKSSLIHGTAGDALDTGDTAFIHDNKTFRSRLKTDQPDINYRNNPVEGLWYQLVDDESDDKSYLRAGTFEPDDYREASRVLDKHEKELIEWLSSPVYLALKKGVEEGKLLRRHGKWLFEALKVVHDDGALVGEILEPARCLFKYVEKARNSPSAGDEFKREVLQASGWAQAKTLKTVDAVSYKERQLSFALRELYGRSAPTSSGSKPSRMDEKPKDDSLDVKTLAAELPSALFAVLKAHDPGEFKSVRQPVDATISAKANMIQQQAAALFANATRSKATVRMIHGPWQYSKNIIDLETQDVSDSRMALLRNRAQMSEVGVLGKVNFKGNRESDWQVLSEILEGMLKDPVVVAVVDRHLRASSRTEDGRVFLQTRRQKVGTGVDAQWHAQWKIIRSLSHELLHVLAHPNFVAANQKAEDSQIIDEGFVEVLGVELYNHILTKARANKEFRREFTDRLAKPDIPSDVGPDEMGYGEAAQKALAIRNRVGKERFEAAFFLGVPDRVGIS